MENDEHKFWQADLIKTSLKGSFVRLDPRLLWHNPVMFVVEIVSVITTVISVGNLIYGGPFGFNVHISIWLWFTVLFANFAEALAEGTGKGPGGNAEEGPERGICETAAARRADRDHTGPRLRERRYGDRRGQRSLSRATERSKKAWRWSTSRPSRVNRPR